MRPAGSPLLSMPVSWPRPPSSQYCVRAALARRRELLLPLLRGDAPRGFAADVYAGELAEAPLLVVLREPVLVGGLVPDPVRHLVEKDVVGVGYGPREVLGAVVAEPLVVGAVLAPRPVAGARRGARGRPAALAVHRGPI